jgi:hypothetical protein
MTHPGLLISPHNIQTAIPMVMVASPDLKSGFQTDSNPDLTKNWDPD